jgi:hypothetical protein
MEADNSKPVWCDTDGAGSSSLQFTSRLRSLRMCHAHDSNGSWHLFQHKLLRCMSWKLQIGHLERVLSTVCLRFDFYVRSEPFLHRLTDAWISGSKSLRRHQLQFQRSDKTQTTVRYSTCFYRYWVERGNPQTKRAAVWKNSDICHRVRASRYTTQKRYLTW